jgi:Ca2+-binding EF-hand superfamily protein
MQKKSVSAQWWKNMFAKFDTNADGYVNWNEAWYYLKDNKP